MISAPALLLLSAPAALAAELTEIAPFLRGDVDISYDFETENARLLEDDTLVANRTIDTHLMRFGGEFTVMTGAQVYFELPIYLGETITFSDSYSMVIDPTTDSGTYLGSEQVDGPVTVQGKGLGGTWLGLKGTPLSETLWPRRGDKVTLLVDVGFRVPDKSSLWTVSEDGQRGAGPGSTAFRLHTAASTKMAWTEPYVAAWLTRSGPAKNVALVDEEGNKLADNAVTVLPAHEIAARFGLEVVPYTEPSSGARFALDVHGDFSYRSWQDIPSGIYLPDVLDGSRGALATQGETSTASAGLGLNYRIFEWAQLNVGGDFGVVMPQSVEHFYDVQTGMGTTTWGVHTTLKLRGRDQPSRFPWDPKQ